MKKRKFIALPACAAIIAALSFGCQDAGSTNPPAVQTSAAGVNPPAENVQAIATDEPDSYSATLRVSAESLGERATTFPNLEAEVARRGQNRRVSLRLPDGEQFIYLSRGATRYVLLPDREQYAEVTSREAGFELPRLLMPGRLVDYLKEQDGYARAGEEELNGRTVVKYVASGAGRTGTRAGSVSAESVVYVDKLTGLPLRAELFSEDAGGVKVVAEMRNVRTGADRDSFAVPRRMKKVESEQVRRQADALANTAARLAGPLLNHLSAAAADTSASARRRRAVQ